MKKKNDLKEKKMERDEVAFDLWKPAFSFPEFSSTDIHLSLSAIEYDVDVENRIAWITLNRPKRFNAISPELPHELKHCVSLANADPRVRVITLRGNGPFFCAGYDLKAFAESPVESPCTQKLPWNPKPDFATMGTNAYPAGYTHCYMSLFESMKPVL